MSKFEMLEGRAKEGPRDKIKLTASHVWDGLIAKTMTKDYIIYYQGRYQYELGERAWIWKPEKIPKKANRRNTSRAQ